MAVFLGNRWVRRMLAALLLLSLAALAFFAWQQFYPVRAADGWRVRALYEDLPRAAALALDTAGDLLVSEELGQGNGRIVRIDRHGLRSVVLQGLSKPDGLLTLAAGRGIAFSQEGGTHPVSLLQNGAVTTLFSATNVQGLWSDAPASLYAIEDRAGDGRLLHFDLGSRVTTVLRDDLNEAESITGCPDGRLFYTEKSRDRVRQLVGDGEDTTFLGGLNKPSFLLCDSRGLWVSEDSSHRARLLLLQPDGQLQVILSYLKAPQTLLPIADGKYLLAEGGRDRVLEISLQ
ncbi:hypothetical protein [Phytopseudomonas dryadis]|nr:hypothetical protein [Pseudomonas dryadis]